LLCAAERLAAVIVELFFSVEKTIKNFLSKASSKAAKGRRQSNKHLFIDIPSVHIFLRLQKKLV